MHFYGFLSNGLTAALIGPDTSVDWLPFPHFDSPSVFSRMLGKMDHGYFRLSMPQGLVVDQHYLDGTHVWVSTLESPRGRAIIHDYLTIPRAELRRIVESDTEITVELLPVFDYGRLAAMSRPTPFGMEFLGEEPDQHLTFSIRPLGSYAPIPADIDPHCFHLPPGRYLLSLTFGDSGGESPSAALVEEECSLEYTVRYWQNQISPGWREAAGIYANALERSVLVLKGLIFRPSGGPIAAPTTSLPEAIGEPRQWDYRYVWVRDAAYMAEAFVNLGDGATSRQILDFLLGTTHGLHSPFPAPVMRIDGSPLSSERELSWLPGHRNSSPCREGNAASAQLQLDIGGECLWAVHRLFAAEPDRDWLARHWDRIREIVHYCQSMWRHKDASLWEFRGQDEHYTHSKMLCWVALYYGARLAQALGHHDLVAEWQREAHTIRQAVERHGFNSQLGYYTQTFNGQRLDASLLMMPLYGFCDVDDPRFQNTLGAIESELVEGPWVYRYREDMLGNTVHPFVLATSWLARVYLLEGRLGQAELLLNQVLRHATTPGLMGEHVDRITGEPRGNFPQAFSHLGVIMHALELLRAKQPASLAEEPAI